MIQLICTNPPGVAGVGFPPQCAAWNFPKDQPVQWNSSGDRNQVLATSFGSFFSPVEDHPTSAYDDLDDGFLPQKRTIYQNYIEWPSWYDDNDSLLTQERTISPLRCLQSLLLDLGVITSARLQTGLDTHQQQHPLQVAMMMMLSWCIWNQYKTHKSDKNVKNWPQVGQRKQVWHSPLFHRRRHPTRCYSPSLASYIYLTHSPKRLALLANGMAWSCWEWCSVGFCFDWSSPTTISCWRNVFPFVCISCPPPPPHPSHLKTTFLPLLMFQLIAL